MERAITSNNELAVYAVKHYKVVNHLNRITAIRLACTINPTLIVIMFKVSFNTIARPNNKNKLVHKNMTMSRLGVRSLSPVIKASSVGIVAQLITTMANHPKVSALILGRYFF